MAQCPFFVGNIALTNEWQKTPVTRSAMSMKETVMNRNRAWVPRHRSGEPGSVLASWWTRAYAAVVIAPTTAIVLGTESVGFSAVSHISKVKK
jgi:hypothetical protein